MNWSESDEFALHLCVWSWCDWNMDGFNEWIADPAEWQGRAHVLEKLCGELEALRHAFKQHHGEDSIKLHANHLRLMATHEAATRTGIELELDEGAGIEQRRHAGKLGGSKTDELRAKIVAVLSRGRQDDFTLKEVLRSWEQSGVEGGLRLTCRPDPHDDYLIADENGDAAQRTYSYRGLEDLFADAAEPSTRRKRR